MHAVLRTTRTRLAAIAVAITALAGTTLVAAPAASAHEIKTGQSCPMSGVVHVFKGRTYVCTLNAAGRAVWGKGLKKSASKVTIADPWAKAADTGMSAAFGMLKNPTGRPVTVIAATSPYATSMQLHEVVMDSGTMVMQQKSGGFTVNAGAMLELKPGGNHIMFMGLRKPITAGALVPVTLIMSDGSQVTFKALGKVYAGANENYDAGASGMDSSMSMG